MKSGFLALLTWISFVSVSSLSAETSADKGPNTIVITYRCSAAHRPMLRQDVLTHLAPRFEKWQKDGIVADYRLLFNSFVDPDTWDLLAIVTFSEFKSIDKWRAIERTEPGGLTPDELEIFSPASEYVMSIVRRSSPTQADVAPGVFLVIPYVFAPTSLERYVKYAQEYVVPEAEDWLKHGNINSYSLMVNPFYPARPLQVLLVIEYKDSNALAQREDVVAKVREELSSDPVWKQWSDNKTDIRVEKEAVIAEELAAH